MKKIISLVLFIVVPLLLVVPGFMGWQAEKAMQDTAAYINGLPAYKASWQSYKRGWFNSEGVLLVSIEDVEGLQLEGGLVELPVAFSLVHGPFLVGNTTDAFSLGLGGFDLLVTLLDQHEEYLQNTLDVKGEGPLYHLAARMDLSGEVVLQDRWLPFDFKADEYSLAVGGYTGEGVIGLDRQLNYALSMPEVILTVVDGDTGEVEVTAKKIEAALYAELAGWHSAQVAPGNFSFSVGELSDNQSNFVVENAQLTAETKIESEKNTLNYTSDLSIGRMTMAQLDTQITQANLSLSYLNFSLDFLEEYYALMAAAPDDAGAEYWQQYLGDLVLGQLLPASPEMKLDTLTFTTKQGQFLASAKLSVEGEALATANLDPRNPMGLLPYIVFNMNSKIDAPLADRFAELYMRNQVEEQLALEERTLTENEIDEIVQAQAPSVLEMLTLQGLVIRKDDALTFDLEYKKGQALLNGNPMPLPF